MPIVSPAEFDPIVIALRLGGLDDGSVAALLGVSQPQYSRLINGQRRLAPERLIAMAAIALGLADELATRQTSGTLRHQRAQMFRRIIRDLVAAGLAELGEVPEEVWRAGTQRGDDASAELVWRIGFAERELLDERPQVEVADNADAIAAKLAEWRGTPRLTPEDEAASYAPAPKGLWDE